MLCVMQMELRKDRKYFSFFPIFTVLHITLCICNKSHGDAKSQEDLIPNIYGDAEFHSFTFL